MCKSTKLWRTTTGKSIQSPHFTGRQFIFHWRTNQIFVFLSLKWILSSVTQIVNSIFSPRDINIWRGEWKWMHKRKRDFLLLLKRIIFLEMPEGGLHFHPFLPILSQTMTVDELFMSLSVGAETSTWGSDGWKLRKRKVNQQSNPQKWQSAVKCLSMVTDKQIFIHQLLFISWFKWSIAK